MYFTKKIKNLFFYSSILIYAVLNYSTAVANEMDDVKAAVDKMQQQLDQQQKRLLSQENEIKRLKTVDGNHPKNESDEILNEVAEYIEEHEGNLHRSKIKISGWADIHFQERAVKGYKTLFDPHRLYLDFDTRLDDNWRIFVEFEFEHIVNFTDNTGQGTFKTERMYFEYNESDLLNIRLGKWSTPLGYWTNAHWAITVPTIVKPIHEDNLYVPGLQVGVEAFGRWQSSSKFSWISNVNYSLWVSNGNELFGTDKPKDDKNGYGTNISGDVFDIVNIGLTTYTQHNPDEGGRRENTIQPYLEIDLTETISLTSEYQFQDRIDTNARDVRSWYISTKWQYNFKSYLNYRLDRGDDEKKGGVGKTTRNILTFGYWPKPYVRTKFEISAHRFDDVLIEDFNQFDAWIGVIF